MYTGIIYLKNEVLVCVPLEYYIPSSFECDHILDSYSVKYDIPRDNLRIVIVNTIPDPR